MAFMYCKLFASLYQGTLRGKSHEILVFTNLLAHADAEGYVDKHFRAIADEVGLTVDEVKTAISLLESPDPESRSPENEGRRLLRINDHRAWGWQVVNYAKYRNIKSDEDRRKANREAQQRYRDKHKDKKSTSIVIESNAYVSGSKQESAPSAQGEGEVKEEEEVEVYRKSKKTKLDIPVFDESDACEFRQIMTDWFNYKIQRKERYIGTGWQRVLAEQRQYPVHFVAASVDRSIQQTWKGLFTDKITDDEAKRFLKYQSVSSPEEPDIDLFAIMLAKRAEIQAKENTENEAPDLTEDDTWS